MGDRRKFRWDGVPDCEHSAHLLGDIQCRGGLFEGQSMPRLRLQLSCMAIALCLGLSGCASHSGGRDHRASGGEWGGVAGQPIEGRRPGTIDAVPISVSVQESSDDNARTLHVTVQWDGMVKDGRTLHLRWQVSKFTNDPPFQIVSPQVVLALSSESHWKKTAAENDTKCPTGVNVRWKFHVPVNELWEVPAGFEWGDGARVDLSVFTSTTSGDRGATGWNTAALAPPGVPRRLPRQ